MRLSAAVFPVCASGAIAAQQQLPIVNPGFEQVSRVLMEDEVTNGSGGVGVPVGTRNSLYGVPSYDAPVEVAGWRTYLPAPGDTDTLIYAGVMNPPPEGFASIDGVVGTHVAALMVAPMQQTLPVRVEPDTTYRLTFRAGFARGFTENGVYVALLGAPDLETPVYFLGPTDRTIGFTAGLYAPQSTEGQMLAYELVATTPEILPPQLTDAFLAISFVGSDGLPLMMFDDFVLTATPVGCPADTNADGALTPADFNAWIIAFNTQAPACDQNADGLCTPADFNAWIANFNVGC